MLRRRRRAPTSGAAPTIEPLGIAESQWRGQQLELARTLVERYLGSSAMPPTLASLDALIDAWFDDRSAERIDVNDLVNAVGVAFGHHLVKATGLSWALATDDEGTELAVHGGPSDALVYPCNRVAERVVKGQRHFLEPLFDELATRLGDG